MANKSLFAHARAPKADARNEAGGLAYSLPAAQALAQLAATGCMNGTFYASADTQLTKVQELALQVDPTFLAKTAVYARERGLMKDMPALLLATLAAKGEVGGDLLTRTFARVVDNGKMLRNFVQIVRSGATGRRSLGSRPKRLILEWLAKRSDDAIFDMSVGNDPSLADILKMVHPTPATPSRRALYGYLIGRPYDIEALPPRVRAYEDYKAGRTKEVPDVNFQLLTSLDLDAAAWKSIARGAGWQATRMNLNTFARHGVFADAALTKVIAERLADKAQVRKARVFPYQLMVAYHQADAQIPGVVRDALQDAMEAATQNVPRVNGPMYVLTDVSGSMHSPATGHRKGATSKVRCIDVAALVAASFLRTNSEAQVLPFHDKVVSCKLNPRDSVMTNAKTLASLPSGGTNCSAPLAELNKRGAKGDLVIFVSDNESWIDGNRAAHRGTAVMEEWAKYKKRNPKAKLVCIDIQPYTTTQAPEGLDILNVGGFSDAVFDLIDAFAHGTIHPNHWIGVIDGIKL